MEYFEDFADLIENEELADFDVFFEKLEELDPSGSDEIIENYMDEIQNALPDAEQDLYMLIENIKTGLLFLSEGLEDYETRRKFAEELFRFREWYLDESLVEIDGCAGSLFGALINERANRLLNNNSDYDFSKALEYELHDFEMSIGSFDKIDIAGIEKSDDKHVH